MSSAVIYGVIRAECVQCTRHDAIKYKNENMASNNILPGNLL